MSSNYKILITGAAAFLASHFVEKLHNLGHSVIGIDNMMGGYEDNIIKGTEFHKLDCCDLSKIQEKIILDLLNWHVNATNSAKAKYI